MKSQEISSEPAGGSNHSSPYLYIRTLILPSPLTKTETWNQSPFPTLSSHFQASLAVTFHARKPHYMRSNPFIISWYVGDMIGSEIWTKFWVGTYPVSAKSVLFIILNAFFHHVLDSGVALQKFNAIHILDCLFAIKNYFSGRLKIFFLSWGFSNYITLYLLVDLFSFTVNSQLVDSFNMYTHDHF